MSQGERVENDTDYVPPMNDVPTKIHGQPTRLSRVLTGVGAAVVVATFALLWGPSLLSGNITGRPLLGVVFVGEIIATLLAVLSVVYATIGLRRAPQRPHGQTGSISALIAALVLLFVAVPALWLGNAFFLL